MLTTALLALSSQAIAADTITIPPGLETQLGACAGYSGDEECVWGMETLVDSNGKPAYVLAQKYAGRKGQHVVWTHTDLIPHPKSSSSESVVTQCEVKGKPDPAVLALVKVEEGVEMWTAIRWAVRLDTSTGKFTEIPVAGIKCLNEGYGL